MPPGDPQRAPRDGWWARAWPEHARRRGAVACLLWPLSRLYAALVALRRACFALGWASSHRLPVPVIVIGNVVVGGAGKTPTVIALLLHLRARGWRPGVVSRGHGREGEQVLEVHAGTPSADSGDEPALIHRATQAPVFVAPRRVDAARALLAAHPEVNLLLCDDGLQHLALARDLAIAVFDDRATGNGWLLPAGLLREPWPPRPGQPFAPHLVLQQHRGPQPPTLPLPPGLPAFQASRRLAGHAVGPAGERMALTGLRGQPLTALAGIARPAVFFEMLRERGLTLAHEWPLPDHAAPALFAQALASAPADGVLVCTEKDAVKLFEAWAEAPAGQRPAVWAVPLELSPEAAFFQAVDERLPPVPGGG